MDTVDTALTDLLVFNLPDIQELPNTIMENVFISPAGDQDVHLELGNQPAIASQHIHVHVGLLDSNMHGHAADLTLTHHPSAVEPTNPDTCPAALNAVPSGAHTLDEGSSPTDEELTTTATENNYFMLIQEHLQDDHMQTLIPSSVPMVSLHFHVLVV